MGTASFSVSKYGRSRGTGAGTIVSSDFRLSGAYSTSTSATNLEDASGDITIAPGEVLTVFADEAMRVVIGGTATATNGIYIPAGTEKDMEAHIGGLVSIIDVA